MKRHPAAAAAPLLIGLPLAAFCVQHFHYRTLLRQVVDLKPKPADPTIITPIVQNDGSIRLGTAAASLAGGALKFEHSFGNLGFWHTIDDRAAWLFRVNRKTTFRLLLEYANNNGRAGNRYDVHVGGVVLGGDALGTPELGDLPDVPRRRGHLGGGRPPA